MSATLSKLRTSWVGKALLAYAVSALALVVLGLAAPGSPPTNAVLIAVLLEMFSMLLELIIN